MLHTYRHADRQTYRPSDEVGCRGAFAPKKMAKIYHCTNFNLLIYK